jgi:hypothetical protein
MCLLLRAFGEMPAREGCRDLVAELGCNFRVIKQPNGIRDTKVRTAGATTCDTDSAAESRWD